MSHECVCVRENMLLTCKALKIKKQGVWPDCDPVSWGVVVNGTQLHHSKAHWATCLLVVGGELLCSCKVACCIYSTLSMVVHSGRTPLRNIHVESVCSLYGMARWRNPFCPWGQSMCGYMCVHLWYCNIIFPSKSVLYNCFPSVNRPEERMNANVILSLYSHHTSLLLQLHLPLAVSPLQCPPLRPTTALQSVHPRGVHLALGLSLFRQRVTACQTPHQ